MNGRERNPRETALDTSCLTREAPAMVQRNGAGKQREDREGEAEIKRNRIQPLSVVPSQCNPAWQALKLAFVRGGLSRAWYGVPGQRDVHTQSYPGLK